MESYVFTPLAVPQMNSARSRLSDAWYSKAIRFVKSGAAFSFPRSWNGNYILFKSDKAIAAIRKYVPVPPNGPVRPSNSLKQLCCISQDVAGRNLEGRSPSRGPCEKTWWRGLTFSTFFCHFCFKNPFETYTYIVPHEDLHNWPKLANEEWNVKLLRGVRRLATGRNEMAGFFRILPIRLFVFCSQLFVIHSDKLRPFTGC